MKVERGGEQLILMEAPTPRRTRKPKIGRPKKPGAGVAHLPRPRLSKHHPVHVVLRVVREVGTLRRRHTYRAIRAATIVSARRNDFRIVQLSLQRTHIHLLVEAADRHALTRGMQSFQISAAKQLNRILSKAGPRRRGRVFSDRYYAEIIKSPRQARHAISYVLNNWRKHAEDRGIMRGACDPFSSGETFTGWRERLPRSSPTGDLLVVRRPETWLLSEGWKRHGLISFHEVPSSRTAAGRAR